MAVLSYMLGKQTPIIAERDPAAELAYREAIIKGLVDLSKQIDDYRLGAAEDLSDQQKEAIKSYNDVLKAWADIKMATAEGQRAKADIMGTILKGTADLTGGYMMRKPNQAVVDQATPEIATSIASGQTYLGSSEGQSALAAALRAQNGQLFIPGTDGSAQINPGVYNLLEQHLGAPIKSVIGSRPSLVEDGTRWWTADALGGSAANGLEAAFGAIPRPPGVDDAQWRALAQAYAADVRDRGVAPFVGDADLAQWRQQAGEQTFTTMWDQAKKFGVQGADLDTISRFSRAYIDAVNKLPDVYGEQIASIDAPAEDAENIQLLRAELDALAEGRDEPTDPLIRARQKLAKVPGIDAFREGLRFRTQDAMERYILRHPGHLKAWVDAVRADPNIAATPDTARAWAVQASVDQGWRRPTKLGATLHKGGPAPAGLPGAAAPATTPATPEAPEADPFKDAGPGRLTETGNTFMRDPDAAPAKAAPATASPVVRRLPGLGGYAYDQHEDGSYTIVSSPNPKGVGAHVPVGGKGWGAILTETERLVRDTPEAGGAPATGGAPPPEDTGEAPAESSAAAAPRRQFDPGMDDAAAQATTSLWDELESMIGTARKVSGDAKLNPEAKTAALAPLRQRITELTAKAAGAAPSTPATGGAPPVPPDTQPEPPPVPTSTDNPPPVPAPPPTSPIIPTTTVPTAEPPPAPVEVAAPRPTQAAQTLRNPRDAALGGFARRSV